MSSLPLDAWEADPLPITVPIELHKAMADALGQDFAISYLCGAVVHNGTLHPRTVTAKAKLRWTSEAMLVLSDASLKLGEAVALEDRLLIHAVESIKQRNERRGR